MDSVPDVANKLTRLTAFIRYVRGPAWSVTATQRAHDTCVTMERTRTPFAEEAALEFCGKYFSAAESKLRQHLTGGYGE